MKKTKSASLRRAGLSCGVMSRHVVSCHATSCRLTGYFIAYDMVCTHWSCNDPLYNTNSLCWDSWAYAISQNSHRTKYRNIISATHKHKTTTTINVTEHSSPRCSVTEVCPFSRKVFGEATQTSRHTTTIVKHMLLIVSLQSSIYITFQG